MLDCMCGAFTNLHSVNNTVDREDALLTCCRAFKFYTAAVCRETKTKWIEERPRALNRQSGRPSPAAVDRTRAAFWSLIWFRLRYSLSAHRAVSTSLYRLI